MKCVRFGRQQLEVVVNAPAQKVTVERLGTNASKLNGQILPPKQPVEIKDGDEVRLVVNDFPCVFEVKSIPFTSDITSQPIEADQTQLVQEVDDIELDIIDEAEADAVSVAGVILDRAQTDDEGDRQASENEEDSGRRCWPDDFSEESYDIAGSDDEMESEEELASDDELKEGLDSHGKKAEKVKIEKEVKPATKPPRKRAIRAPKEPKLNENKRVTAYGLFAFAMRPQMKRDYPSEPSKSITNLIKARWRALDEEEKEDFREKAIAHNSAVSVEDGQSESDGNGEELTARSPSPIAKRRRPNPVRRRNTRLASNSDDPFGDFDEVDRNDTDQPSSPFRMSDKHNEYARTNPTTGSLLRTSDTDSDTDDVRPAANLGDPALLYALPHDDLRFAARVEPPRSLLYNDSEEDDEF
ncbi:hypothetical protein HDU85_000754 [Gaertneriomyces sp. JEL0708]|nr:hypothetical protein HDU85_000754 [Gaertneriomyces sp. JEL0708]